jgi:hypothetical protein
MQIFCHGGCLSMRHEPVLYRLFGLFCLNETAQAPTSTPRRQLGTPSRGRSCRDARPFRPRSTPGRVRADQDEAVLSPSPARRRGRGGGVTGRPSFLPPSRPLTSRSAAPAVWPKAVLCVIGTGVSCPPSAVTAVPEVLVNCRLILEDRPTESTAAGRPNIVTRAHRAGMRPQEMY